MFEYRRRHTRGGGTINGCSKFTLFLVENAANDDDVCLWVCVRTRRKSSKSVVDKIIGKIEETVGKCTFSVCVVTKRNCAKEFRLE